MDMEDLMAPAAFGDDHEDILGLLAGGGSLSDVLANQGALQGDHRGLRLQGGEVSLLSRTHVRCTRQYRICSAQHSTCGEALSLTRAS